MDGELVAERASRGDLHRIDVADQVGDRDIGRRELLDVAIVAVHPGDRRLVALLRHAAARAYAETGANGSSWISLPATIGSHSSSSAAELADHARLRLPAFAEEDQVVAAEQRVLDRGHHRVVVAEDAVEERLGRADARQQVRAQLLAQRSRLPRPALRSAPSVRGAGGLDAMRSPSGWRRSVAATGRRQTAAAIGVPPPRPLGQQLLGVERPALRSVSVTCLMIESTERSIDSLSTIGMS